jgi:hypothetical protein
MISGDRKIQNNNNNKKKKKKKKLISRGLPRFRM